MWLRLKATFSMVSGTDGASALPPKPKKSPPPEGATSLCLSDEDLVSYPLAL